MERNFQRPIADIVEYNITGQLVSRAPLIYSSIERMAGIIECRDPYVNGIIDPLKARELLLNRGVSAVGIYVAGSLLSHKAGKIFNNWKTCKVSGQNRLG